MKKVIISVIALCFLFTACTKETANVSKIVDVTYPTITLNGDAIVSTSVGTGAYVDPGATGKDDLTGETQNLTPILNNVDLTAPGFYTVQYKMTNSNGFYITSSRLVLVTGVSASIDLSGTYARQSNGQTVTVTKKGTGLYTTSNVGGVANNPPFIFDVYFGQTSDTTIAVPIQSCPLGGDLYCSNGTLNLTAPIKYSYIVHNANFGTATRVFVHQ